ncbi:MAG: hypothetical protein M1814_002953 [Vezdaea aestivalis]|nr:MAG: hypothetical protein M1814_002953 [Vezdaea aestivalis]
MADDPPIKGVADMQLNGPDILVDPEDYNDVEDKQGVAIINPNQLDELVPEAEPVLLANDFPSMLEKLLPKIPDYETENETYHTWQIDGYRNLKQRSNGPQFLCGGQPWQILLFPFGNNVDNASIYLEHGPLENAPENWYQCAQFCIVMWNPRDPSIYTSHYAMHRFTQEEADWGFTRFEETRKLYAVPYGEGHEGPMIEDDKVNLTAYVRILKDPTGVLWHNFIKYDSREATGYVGLRNHGATCYLNSLLQSLYFTNAFRKAVYQIPTEDSEDLESNYAYTLQRLFYLLQTSKDPVSTLELTRSFGWETKQIFEQQDVQELSRKLMEKLEEKMKGTAAENALPRLFVGKTKTYVSCIDVDYESSRTEDYWDIQLNVRGNKNLDESFKDYISVETMDGENKYFAEGHGLQDARKGDAFLTFPDVLHLQLKRFEYDMHRDAMVKVNDRYEFPEEFDAALYLSEDADRSESWEYQLHGVLVHSGDHNAGHYYAFLKPKKDGWFYRCDDDRVTKSLMKDVLDENFGGEYANQQNGSVGKPNPYTRTVSKLRSMSAYMLVYIRKSKLDDVLVDVTDNDIPKHLEQRLEEERVIREIKKKEKEESHLYITVYVVTPSSFRAYEGLDLTTWESKSENPGRPKAYRVLKKTLTGDFLKLIAEDEDEDPLRLRLWIMVNRQNKTVRPDRPIEEMDLTVEEIFQHFGTRPYGYRLWVERAEKVQDGKAIYPNQLPNTNNYIALLVKYFDHENQTLKGVGSIYVRKTDKVADLYTPTCQLLGWPTTTPLKLHEEIKPAMIDPMKPKQTLQAAEIQDGDIICVEKQISDKDANAMAKQTKYADAREFYDYLLNRLLVHFRPHPNAAEDLEAFDLVVNRKMTYDALASAVGNHLQLDSTFLRFSTINASSNLPKMQLKRQQTMTLMQILSAQYGYTNHNTAPDALFYEILETTLSEIESKKVLKVIYLSEGITKEQNLEVLVPKHGTIKDVSLAVKEKAKLDEETASSLRFYLAHAGKLHKEVADNYPVASNYDTTQLYVEKIPDDELVKCEGDRAISAFHFNKEPGKVHGIPFKFIIKADELFKDTKVRLEKRTGLKGKMLEKIKFAVVTRLSYSKPVYLKDDDILAEIATSPEDLLGLDHADRSRGLWGRADAIFIR